MQKITPFLWFDKEAEEAVDFYVSIFKNAKKGAVTRYGKSTEEVSGKPAGSVMTVAFELEGQDFLALNGGPDFKFTEAVSFMINCDTQEEVDHYWDKLSEGGDEKAQQCGWLKDKYGLSWQVVPTVMDEMLRDAEIERSDRVMRAMLGMKKPDIRALRDAYGEQA